MDNEHDVDVRFLKDLGWQILLKFPHKWHTCHSEQDARFISHGMRLSAAVMRGRHAGEETAQELDEAAATLFRNIGPSAAGALMHASSQSARGQAIGALTLS